ncbi:MAG: ribosomal protein S18-alanine N-acetyltransferase, partial [Selenomonadaceae bacterium]|nr:ribosomal protein S18-alanine N-acetyltransferase [Selenomonadaceae bacterium]
MGQKSQIIFRKMTADDVETVAEIEFKSFSLPWTLEDFWHEVLNKDSESIVAEIDGKVVAYACVWISFDEADVANIAVAENFRGQGIGKKLFAEVLRRVKMRGVNALTLEVRVSNTAAIKLYESFGLRSVGVRKKYYCNPEEDALIMW